jgi:formylglycine-generating enzyme required for sulfatase activity
MRFVWIKPDSFWMGSPDGTTPAGVPAEDERKDDEAYHRVTLTRGLYMSAHLVTQYEWEQVLGKARNLSDIVGANDEDKKQRPVDTVSWDDCQEFCAKLSLRGEGTYRLPTEAQWEYACRAGSAAPFWWGGSITTEQANYDGRTAYGPQGKKGDFLNKATPVDHFPPNPWGLFDMHGNLWQWCEDCYGCYPLTDAVDPVHTEKDLKAPRVLRGGSFNSRPFSCRSAFRGSDAPGSRDKYRGCRVVLYADEDDKVTR